jgi:hypothetical protein
MQQWPVFVKRRDIEAKVLSGLSTFAMSGKPPPGAGYAQPSILGLSPTAQFYAFCNPSD